ncbi:hypothetical protein ACW7N6_38320 [Streptomyces sp. UC1A3]
MAVDTLSRRALLEAKQDHDVAPRLKVWPPEGYTAPTAAEFADLLWRAKSFRTAPPVRAQWERMDDATVLRRAQLCELATHLRGQEAGFVYGYARALRAEMNRRGTTYRSIAVLRCESCSHATERLFEATQETHPGMENRHGARIASAFFCARCWSGATVGDVAEGLADEDGTEEAG